MRVVAILNREGGTLRTTDLDMYARHLTTAFSRAGHAIDCHVVPGAALIETLEGAATDQTVDAILCGGGDGSVSAAAGICWKADKILGIIPAGTMNLFARSLRIPTDILDAATVLADAESRPVDIATANGRPFVHQFAVGIHSQVVRLRQRSAYRSRIGKILASIKAMFAILARPPVLTVRIRIKDAMREERVSLVAVSNNLYGEGHMPYADRVDEGILGIYRADVLPPTGVLRLAIDLLFGRYRDNPDFHADTADAVTLEFPRRRRARKAVIDGELIPLEESVRIVMHAGELRVLAPKAAGDPGRQA